LQSTTLQQLGFSTGSCVIRVLFKETDVTIDAVLPLFDQTESETETPVTKIPDIVKRQEDQRPSASPAVSKPALDSESTSTVPDNRQTEQVSCSVQMDRNVKVVRLNDQISASKSMSALTFLRLLNICERKEIS
jgi:hypothetical protein